jgi:hypothetical protein
VHAVENDQWRFHMFSSILDNNIEDFQDIGQGEEKGDCARSFQVTLRNGISTIYSLSNLLELLLLQGGPAAPMSAASDYPSPSHNKAAHLHPEGR